ncbi:hypothetical protein BUPH_02943 [Paraburkholderia phenoliruptrix BR3459a]|uniref:Uncharacterized protein n=1 Tax=Paraburkholderia phenoliruptrix BR3459a TaxID=1229205 RepID=K0DSZ8_9BURK|nr:hypothetical protein BUPH_02943 [Paraburkholderia phenoliruptrix BR3459a]
MWAGATLLRLSPVPFDVGPLSRRRDGSSRNSRGVRLKSWSAKSVRFPALALSRSGSKGISHPRCTDLQPQCTAGPPR